MIVAESCVLLQYLNVHLPMVLLLNLLLVTAHIFIKQVIAFSFILQKGILPEILYCGNIEKQIFHPVQYWTEMVKMFLCLFQYWTSRNMRLNVKLC